MNDDRIDRIRAYQDAARRIATSDAPFGDRVLMLADLREHAFGEVLDECLVALHVGARVMFAPQPESLPIDGDVNVLRTLLHQGLSRCPRCTRQLPREEALDGHR